MNNRNLFVHFDLNNSLEFAASRKSNSKINGRICVQRIGVINFLIRLNVERHHPETILMAIKELSKKNKFYLIKKLKGYIRTIRVLGVALVISAGVAFFAFRQEWVSKDFPAYPVLLSLAIAAAIVATYIQILWTKKAILTSKKLVITGPIQRKISHSNEFSTEYGFEVGGIKYDVKAKYFDAFKEGETVKIEYAEPGKELIRVKLVKEA